MCFNVLEQIQYWGAISTEVFQLDFWKCRKFRFLRAVAIKRSNATNWITTLPRWGCTMFMACTLGSRGILSTGSSTVTALTSFTKFLLEGGLKAYLKSSKATPRPNISIIKAFISDSLRCKQTNEQTHIQKQLSYKTHSATQFYYYSSLYL